MDAVLKKWGNSVGIRLPSALLKETRLRENQRVEVLARKGEIVIKPSNARRYRLSDLISGITPKNRHVSVEFGRPVGSELL
jgi:antitoxin MazE